MADEELVELRATTSIKEQRPGRVQLERTELMVSAEGICAEWLGAGHEAAGTHSEITLDG